MELNWNGRLTLYYDSVEELGWLAGFKVFFRFDQDHFRIEYVAFTLMGGNSKSDKLLKSFQIGLKSNMTIDKTTRH